MLDKIVEIDKYAVTSYNAIHHTRFKPLDICNVSASDLKLDKNLGGGVDIKIMTYSFPCTSISLSGLQKGYTKGSGTASALLWEVQRILKEATYKPFLLMENVTQVHSKKYENVWNEWLNFLNSLGYENVWIDLNAKSFNVPQNRNRCYMFSYLRNDYPNIEFDLEIPRIPLTRTFEDVLEDEVDSKYFLSKDKIDSFRKEISSNKDKETVQVVGRISGNYDLIRRVYNPKGVSPTLTTMQGGGHEPKIYLSTSKVVIDDTMGFDGVRLYDSYSPALRAERNGLKVCIAQRGRYNDKGTTSQRFEARTDNVSNCITTVQKDSMILNIPFVKDGERETFTIRKFTPKECFRLMAFDDEDFKKAKQALIETYYRGVDRADSQLYKQAGNSIVVTVLEKIFEKIIKIFL